MDTQQIENKKKTDELKQNLDLAGGKLKPGSIKESEEAKQQQQVQQPLILCSPTSSPSHEFSFTIPLNSSSFANKSKPPTPSLSAMDLSPADDIFFHGHLLPLHHLSHLPISPRNSLDSFTLPIQNLLHVHTSNNIKKHEESDSEMPRITIRPKAKSFSIFGRSKWRKERENGEKERQKKKPKFEVSQMLKRYMRMVRPLLSMKSKIRGNGGGMFQKQPYSFSGNVSLRHDENDSSFETRRREFSAPASMWTSPSNSGVLMAKRKNLSSPNSSDSTMEELQAAIQAAITHCKNSIAMEENIKCND